MDELFKEKSVYIRIFMGTETQLDPYEKNKSLTLINPIPIKAIVNDLTSAKIQ